MTIYIWDDKPDSDGDYCLRAYPSKKRDPGVNIRGPHVGWVTPPDPDIHRKSTDHLPLPLPLNDRWVYYVSNVDGGITGYAETDVAAKIAVELLVS